MIQLDLTLDEVNQVLEALGQQPFKEVFQLIAKIQQQAAAQLQNENRAPALGGAKPKGE